MKTRKRTPISCTSPPQRFTAKPWPSSCRPSPAGSRARTRAGSLGSRSERPAAASSGACWRARQTPRPAPRQPHERAHREKQRRDPDAASASESASGSTSGTRKAIGFSCAAAPRLSDRCRGATAPPCPRTRRRAARRTTARRAPRGLVLRRRLVAQRVSSGPRLLGRACRRSGRPARGAPGVRRWTLPPVGSGRTHQSSPR